MNPAPITSLAKRFASLPDPRRQRTQRHQLLDILAIAILGTLCGADSWVDIADFGRAKEDWLRQFLELPNGIPSHDTFGRVFARLDPEAFRACFLDFVHDVHDLTQDQLIAIDGKTLRGSLNHSSGQKPIHMVSAWAAADHLVLGQVKGNEKSNEITAIPQLLRLLDISGCVVTLDAMGCQREIAQQITQQGGDYVLALKGNQGHLADLVRDLFHYAESVNYAQVDEQGIYQTVNKGHGRIETRQCWVLSAPKQLEYLQTVAYWPGLTSIVKVTSERRIGDTASCETRYYLTSLPGDARRLLQAVRKHWSIENELHWVLDIAFLEDKNRAHKDHAPENLAILRQLALNLLKQEKTAKCGTKGKRLQAGWDHDYLMKVISV